MYCVRCDAQGQLDHATVIYGGESLCEPHFKWVREMNLSGSHFIKNPVDAALVPSDIEAGDLASPVRYLDRP